MSPIFNSEIAGNSLWRIVLFFLIILIALFTGKIVKFILFKSCDNFKKQNRLITATTLEALARSSVLLFAAIGIAAGLSLLNLQSRVAHISHVTSVIILTVAIGYFLYWLAEIPAVWFTGLASKSESRFEDMLAPIIRKSLRITIVILVLVQIAQTLSDKPITSIIAGLGIGGLAVALAAQDSLKNFFGSIVLFADKPFEMGERVVIDGHDGAVETVGLRSTKIRTLDGHLVTVPNGELANKTIQNIGKRPYIKRIANITITYDTSPEKIDRAIEIIRGLLDNHEGMNPDLPPRVYFNEFNADSLNILVIYWFHPPDYWAYLEFSQKFNKALYVKFNEEGIDFAFPTQTVYLAGDESRPLTVGVNRIVEKV